jgi:hypothetical protein
MGGRLVARRPWAALLFCGLGLLLPTAARADQPPTLGTVWVSEVAPETATANAYLDPHGLPTSWHFEYLTDAAYAANLAAGLEGFAGATAAPAPGQAMPISAPQIVSWPLGGLAQSTTYHLRAVAQSSAGTVASLAPPLFATTTTLVPCVGDACQPLPSPPEDPTPGTQVPGPGNPPVHFPKIRITKCPRGKVKKHGRCVRRHPRRHHHHRGHHRGARR